MNYKYYNILLITFTMTIYIHNKLFFSQYSSKQEET